MYIAGYIICGEGFGKSAIESEMPQPADEFILDKI